MIHGDTKLDLAYGVTREQREDSNEGKVNSVKERLCAVT